MPRCVVSCLSVITSVACSRYELVDLDASELNNTSHDGFSGEHQRWPDEPPPLGDAPALGPAPSIQLRPAHLDLAAVAIGCEAGATVAITNVGTAPLRLDEIEFIANAADLSWLTPSSLALPLSLAPGASLDLELHFAPWAPAVVDGALWVHSNDPARPTATATQTARTHPQQLGLDVFEQPLQSKADVVFAVDRSSSERNDIEELQSHIGALTAELTALDVDFQLAATVEDDGCINGDALFIDDSFSASEASEALNEMIALGRSYGANTERAFSLWETALAEAATPSGCNAGLVRPDATLHLVGLSHEPEQSHRPWSTYVAQFQGYKSDQSDVIIHGMGGPAPSGCGAVLAYDGVWEASLATGGGFLALCNEVWPDILLDLADAMRPDLSAFALSDRPLVETLRVKLDGVTQTTGWAYDAVENAVVFDDAHVPERGSTVEVTYAHAADCAAR